MHNKMAEIIEPINIYKKMNIRSVVHVGCSFYVSLPKQWLRKHKLGKGDKVVLTPLKDGSILIRAKRQVKVVNNVS